MKYLKKFNENHNDNGLTLVEISDNEYRISGKIYNYSKGEIFDCDKSFENKDNDENGRHWEKKKFDQFASFGLPIYYVWDYTDWKNYSTEYGLLRTLSNCDSSATIVKEIIALYDHNIIDKSIILDINWGKRFHYEIYNNEIKFLIQHYTSGYEIYVNISINKFLDMNFTLFNYKMKNQLEIYIDQRYFPQYIINTKQLSEKQKEGIIKKIESINSIKYR